MEVKRAHEEVVAMEKARKRRATAVVT